MARLEEIINEARSLSQTEKEQLRNALDLDLQSDRGRDHSASGHNTNGDDDAVRARRLEWLKSHRDEYGGQYVALDHDTLLAVGPTYRIAREKALAAGKPHAFITYLAKSDEMAEIGGWE